LTASYQVVVHQEKTVVAELTGVFGKSSASTASGSDATTRPGEAQVVFNPTNGHYYEVVSVSVGLGWNDANKAARSRIYKGLRGHLVTITSYEESQFIHDHFPEAWRGSFWLGGYQDRTAPDYKEPNGGWRWVTGEPWGYTDWADRSPDNYGGSQDYLRFYGVTGQWDDTSQNDSILGYLVEYEAKR
jgi:hypothetical protein